MTQNTLRIIPARAGQEQATGPSGDHPRSRGVYKRMSCPRSERSGSSPLARGLRRRTMVLWITRRIIPARAGFTRSLGAATEAHRDHPRSRGVYRPRRLSRRTRAGSSPLARGLPVEEADPRFDDRIIPARAGFTGRHPRRRLGCPDHPRSRGVYITRSLTLPQVRGSSPLARGLRAVLTFDIHRLGIIPARAGFTCPQSG